MTRKDYVAIAAAIKAHAYSPNAEINARNAAEGTRWRIDVYQDWVTLSGIDHGEGDEYEDVRRINDVVRAAIAKAKGAA